MTIEFHHAPPPAPLRGLVARITTYRETGPAAIVQREVAPLLVPIIVSLGGPFRIALGRAPTAADAQPSFASGLFAGPVHIASDGDAACVQLDLHPLAAFRVFGGGIAELGAGMVPLADLFGAAGRGLVERIGNAPDTAWADLVAGFVASRLGPPPSAVTLATWQALAASGGQARIAAIGAREGVSRKRIHARFSAEIGAPPKTVARMMRFAAACRIAGAASGWADVAAAAGYADQAHLTREFRALSGLSPSAWAAETHPPGLAPGLLEPA